MESGTAVMGAISFLSPASSLARSMFPYWSTWLRMARSLGQNPIDSSKPPLLRRRLEKRKDIAGLDILKQRFPAHLLGVGAEEHGHPSPSEDHIRSRECSGGLPHRLFLLPVPNVTV